VRSGNGSCIASVHVHQARTCVLIPGVPEAEASARAELEGVVINRVHPANLAALGGRLGVPFPA
jgi:hypothetical protein